MILELFNKKISWPDLIGSDNISKNLASDEEIWPYLILGFSKYIEKPLIVLAATVESVADIYRDMTVLDSKSKILDFPIIRQSSGYNEPKYYEKLSKRLEVIQAIKSIHKDKGYPIIISSITSIIQPASKGSLEQTGSISISEKASIGRDDLIEQLIRAGYERVDTVFDKGEFSAKGDTVEVFNIADSMPVKLDLEYDEVSSIKSLDISTRKTIKGFKRYKIFNTLDPWSENDDSEKTGLLDYLDSNIGPDDYGICICEPLEVDIKIRSELDVLAALKDGLEKARTQGYIDDSSFLAGIKKRPILLNLSSKRIQGIDTKYDTFKVLKGQKSSFGNVKHFLKNVQDDLEAEKKVLISIGDEKRLLKLKDIFTENNHSFLTVKGSSDEKEIDQDIINLRSEELIHGFETEDLSVYGELDIFTFKSFEEERESISPWITEISPGSLIVHKNFGVGRYISNVSRSIDGQKKEYFLIEYADNDRLYVPIWQADRLHRYIGEKEPKITPLGSKHWDNLKNKIRNSIKTLAIDLAKLYAERKSIKGHAFTEESHWQKDMEDLFPFTETADQSYAIKTVKKKMSQDTPMDLLVCGDVGFGKTEVAIRAAFKAIIAGKQVLMLVPTTILADQHYKTFSQRYEGYPILLDVISRFKSRAEQKKIVEDFKSGKLDMLIGTHRLLSKDIKANDLGLLIIDEEQRFGVNSKEKLKLLRKEVDVLTLTATPIPRTLHMSLTGLKDIVQIDTSPMGRQPIETFVGERDDFIIRMAIERELDRGGQVYYVYNRINGIKRRREYLNSLVPNAKVALTHGRMDGEKIERIMEDFIDRKYDILLTTSIIESGMDISNVNTLIIEDSHRFGISQLYQLRGRVGRSSQKAYAYFLYPGKSALNQNAFERLRTLSEITELGSGYKIALKDLELRGAGELLGARQHGHMNAVGFDYYCQMVNEEVGRLKGIEMEEDINIQIEIPINSYIPKSYIQDENRRIATYKALADLRDEEEIEALKTRLTSKFGPLPPIVINLFKISLIKILLKRLKMQKITYSRKDNNFIIGKRVLEERLFKKTDNMKKGLSYNKRTKSIYIKDINKNIDLDSVISILSDIILII